MRKQGERDAAMVRRKGLEPLRLAALEPKSSASANSATFAGVANSSRDAPILSAFLAAAPACRCPCPLITTKTSPSPRCCCPRRCAPRWRRSTASRAPPTTSPTKETWRPMNGCAAWPACAPDWMPSRPTGPPRIRSFLPWARLSTSTIYPWFRSTTCWTPFARTWPRRATPTSPSSWTTAAARPTRWAACCCACTAPTRRTTCAPRTPSAARCSSSTSGRMWRSTGARTASICPRRTCAASASPKSMSPPGAATRPGGRSWPFRWRAPAA